MKRITLLLLVAVLASLLVSCSLGYAPVAYTRFAASGTQCVYYSSDYFANAQDHIKVYKDQAAMDDDDIQPDLSFNFYRCLGHNDIGDYRYALVSVLRGRADMMVTIQPDAYSPSKSFYLNGTEISPVRTHNYEYIHILEFEDLVFVQTNPWGRLNPEAVNVLEYR